MDKDKMKSALDTALSNEIGTLFKVLVSNLIAKDNDAQLKFAAGLKIHMAAYSMAMVAIDRMEKN